MGRMLKRTMCVCVCLLCLLLLPVSSLSQELLEVYFLDVGQGDATLVLSGGHAMLVDGGGPESSQFIYSFLRDTMGLEYLDYIVATHPHSDHVGGLAAAVNACDAGMIFSPVWYAEDEGFQNLVRQMRKKNLFFTFPASGNTLPLGDATVTFLAPIYPMSKVNNLSVILRVSAGDTAVLLCADAEMEEEESLLSSGQELRADVLKAGHHGSGTSTGERFLEAAGPEYAVISCGALNPYGHPDAAVLQRLWEHNVSVLRTDLQGTIHGIYDGNAWSFTSKRQAPPDEKRQTEEKTVVRGMPEQSDVEYAYIGNASSRKFHLPGCTGVSTMLDKNKVFFESREDAVALGYVPCGICHP